MDEETAKADGAVVLAVIFLGDALMIFFDLFKVPGKPPVTEARVKTYWLDGNKMFVPTQDRVWEQVWHLTDGNVLFLEIGRDWVPLYASTVEQLVARGFDRQKIEVYLDTAKMVGESFDEEPPFLRAVSWLGSVT